LTKRFIVSIRFTELTAFTSVAHLIRGDEHLRTSSGTRNPIPVEVRQPSPTTLESIAALISPLLRPLTTTGIMALRT
jgi:hypothetical protein